MKRIIALLLLLALLLTACAAKSKSEFETAVDCIGKPLSSLTDQIGQPKDVSYASSCLGDGEDGELYYDGFTVYTYRDTDGTENIYDVIEVTD